MTSSMPTSRELLVAIFQRKIFDAGDITLTPPFTTFAESVGSYLRRSGACARTCNACSHLGTCDITRRWLTGRGARSRVESVALLYVPLRGDAPEEAVSGETQCTEGRSPNSVAFLGRV